MIKELFCEIFLTCAVVVSTPLTREELMHRSVLFDAYQNDYAGAFVNALALEELGLVDPADASFALTKGSLAVQQGLNGYAAATFARVESGPLSASERLRLSLEKARLYQRQGDFDALKDELARIPKDGSQVGLVRHSELIFLQAELMLHQRQFESAGRLIETLDSEDPYRAYALFNMAMTLRDSGRTADAFDVLRVLLAMPGAHREIRDLKDRSRIALAHLSYELDRGDDAAALLEDLPADSRYRNNAVSAYGAYAMQQGDYELAARLFQSAVHEQPWPTEVAYAQIGLPMALQGMTEPAMVLSHFRQAQVRLERRVNVLGEVQKNLLDRSFVTALVRATATSAEPGALVKATARWNNELPGQEWLDWMAGGEIAEAVAEWQTLDALRSWTFDVPEKIRGYEVSARNGQDTADLVRRAELLQGRLGVALSAAEDRIASLLAARVQTEMERVKSYLLTADLALAQASDQVAAYAREVPERDRAPEAEDKP